MWVLAWLTASRSALQGSGCIWGQGGREGSHSASEGLPRRRCGLWHGNSRRCSCVMQPHWHGSTFDWAAVVALRWGGRTVAGLCGTSGRRCQCPLTWAPRCRSSFTPGRQVRVEFGLKALDFNKISRGSVCLKLSVNHFKVSFCKGRPIYKIGVEGVTQHLFLYVYYTYENHFI